MRALPLGPGIGTVSDPSLGVLAMIVVGKVRPPSVESVIFTFAQLTGALFVLATFQVIVWFVPVAHDAPAAGLVTTKGPASLRTFTCVAAEFTPPPPLRLSRAVTRKFIVRVVVGRDSPMLAKPDRTSCNCGNEREGLVNG